VALLWTFSNTYTQRLKYLGLSSLQYRRLRADMIETYKILNNIDKVQYEQILPLNQTTTRGHSKKLYKKNCRTNVRKYSFSQRVVDDSLVALLWTFSNCMASFLYITDHTLLPYSRCGLTILLNTVRNISLSIKSFKSNYH
jgi:hypothetical protein